MRVIETKLFSFEELSEEAKERARDWYRECIESDELADHDDWSAVAEILGIEFDTRAVPLMGGSVRRYPCIYWSLGYSQGDYAAFDGSYRYAKGAAKRIREYAPTDKALHRIADALQSAQSRAFYSIEARAKVNRNWQYVEAWDSRDEYRDIGDSGIAVEEAIRDFAQWIYDQIRAQNDYLNSDECVDESILANEYEFTEDGNIA